MIIEASIPTLERMLALRKEIDIRIDHTEIDRLERIHFPMPEAFPLWVFSVPWNENDYAGTRGRTAKEALFYLALYRFSPVAKLHTSLPLTYAQHYTRNHDLGWEKRPPVWLLKLKELQAHGKFIDINP